MEVNLATTNNLNKVNSNSNNNHNTVKPTTDMPLHLRLKEDMSNLPTLLLLRPHT